MDVSIMLASAVLAMLISGASHGTEITDPIGSYENCAANCVSTTRHRNNLLVVARNKRGEIFKTLSLELPPGARQVPGEARGVYGGSDLRIDESDVEMMSGLPVGSLCIGIPGVCTETSLVRYETTTQFVFYTFTFVFNHGDLVEVRVDETRVARSKID